METSARASPRVTVSTNPREMWVLLLVNPWAQIGVPSASTQETGLPVISLEYAGVQVEVEYRARLGGMCFCKRDCWMTRNKLKLNTDKTQIAVMSADHRPRPPIDSLKCCVHNISSSSSVRDIGVIFDDKMSLENQITSICKSSFFHIKNIWKIRKCISLKACETLVHAFISSKLDFCNSLLYGMPRDLIQRPQQVQNAAARLVYCCHLQYKILLSLSLRLTFKTLNGSAPS